MFLNPSGGAAWRELETGRGAIEAFSIMAVNTVKGTVESKQTPKNYSCLKQK